MCRHVTAERPALRLTVAWRRFTPCQLLYTSARNRPAPIDGLCSVKKPAYLALCGNH